MTKPTRVYDYILLDWDGNLAQTLEIWKEAFELALQKRGYDGLGQDLHITKGPVKDRIRKLGMEDAQGVLADAEEVVLQSVPQIELYPDVFYVLDALHKRGKKLALVTTSAHKNVAPLFEKYQLDKFFGALVTHHDTKNHKPHVEPLERAMMLLDGDKHSAVMIGDSSSDLGAAKNYGIDSILFYPDEHKAYYDLDELHEHEPTHVVSEFRKILDIIG